MCQFELKRHSKKTWSRGMLAGLYVYQEWDRRGGVIESKEKSREGVFCI